MTREYLEQILMLFGYPVSSWDRFELKLLLPDAVQGELNKNLNFLNKIDSQLEAALEESMARQVGEMSLDYKAHVQHLKAEGRRTLANLSALVDIPVYNNKYGTQTKISSMF